MKAQNRRISYCHQITDVFSETRTDVFFETRTDVFFEVYRLIFRQQNTNPKRWMSGDSEYKQAIHGAKNCALVRSLCLVSHERFSGWKVGVQLVGVGRGYFYYNIRLCGRSPPLVTCDVADLFLFTHRLRSCPTERTFPLGKARWSAIAEITPYVCRSH